MIGSKALVYLSNTANKSFHHTKKEYFYSIFKNHALFDKTKQTTCHQVACFTAIVP